MARVPVAENRVGIASVTDAKLQAADTGAGGFGRGLTAVGQGLGQYAETLHQMDLDAQSADASAKFASARLAIDKARTDARSTAGPGAAGYTEAMDKAVGDAITPILEGIKDKRLRNRFSTQMQAFRSEVIGNDYGWEIGKRVEKTKTDTVGAIDIGSARVRSSPDANSYAVEKRNADDLINSAPLDEATKADLRKYSDRSLAGAAIGSGLDSDPNAIRESLKRGDWNGVLDGKEIDTYMAQADVAINRINTAKEHQAALAKSQLSEQIATVKAQLSAGIDVPDDQLAALAGRATEVGDTSGAFDLNEARVRSGVNKETKGWTPQQWEAERNRLRAMGQKISPTNAVRLDQIEKRMGSAVSEFDKDPGAWASSNGVPPPQIDWNNPNSINARRQWQATVSRASGRPAPFFSPNEQADLRAQAEGGPQNELNVINKVAMIGGRGAVTEMLRILPNDPKAARLVTLNQFDRGTAMNGVKLLAENPKLLLEKDSRPAFDQRMGTAAMLMDGNEAEGIYATARGIYVAEQRKAGKDSATFDQGAWNSALHRALGGKYDGQNWYGGVWTWGKNSVLISPTITGKQFEGAMTKLGGAGQWRDGAAPVYANKQPIPPGELVRNFTPVMRPDGWYEFVDKNGNPVPAANGKAFLIDIEATARKYPK